MLGGAAGRSALDIRAAASGHLPDHFYHAFRVPCGIGFVFCLIQQANAVRRRNPLALTYRPDAQTAGAAGRPGIAAGTGSIDAARLQAATLKQPPTVSGHDDQPGARKPAAAGDAELALAGSDAGSVNEWMLQALDKYENMRRQQPS